MFHSFRIGDRVLIAPLFASATPTAIGTITDTSISTLGYYHVQPEGSAQVLVVHKCDLVPAEPAGLSRALGATIN
jgi:hypothetical protein